MSFRGNIRLQLQPPQGIPEFTRASVRVSHEEICPVQNEFSFLVESLLDSEVPNKYAALRLRKTVSLVNGDPGYFDKCRKERVIVQYCPSKIERVTLEWFQSTESGQVATIVGAIPSGWKFLWSEKAIRVSAERWITYFSNGAVLVFSNVSKTFLIEFELVLGKFVEAAEEGEWAKKKFMAVEKRGGSNWL